VKEKYKIFQMAILSNIFVTASVKNIFKIVHKKEKYLEENISKFDYIKMKKTAKR
jgi:hypothetical protein